MNPLKLRQIVCAPAGDSEAGGSEGGVTGTLTQAKQSITTTARDTASRIKSAASETATRAKDEAQRFASETKEQTAARIGGYSNSLHESAKSFEQQDPNIAWAAHQLADKVQGAADYIRTSDLNDLRNDVETWARRHPLAFFGGLFVGGLVIGNLLKARQPNRYESEDFSSQWDAGNASGSEPFTETSTGEI